MKKSLALKDIHTNMAYNFHIRTNLNAKYSHCFKTKINNTQ